MINAEQPGMLRKVDTTHVPISHYLGAVGMPGVTAWYGLVKLLEPKAGQTVLCLSPKLRSIEGRIILDRLGRTISLGAELDWDCQKTDTSGIEVSLKSVASSSCG